MLAFQVYESVQTVKNEPGQVETLWQAYSRDKSQDVRNDLLMHYIDLVKRVVYRLFTSTSPYHDYEDLISCGVIGLMDAIDRYDPRRGARFETYAQIRIKGEIVDYMRRQDWAPVGLRTRLRQVQAAYDELAQILGSEPGEQQVADHLGIELSELQQRLGESYLVNLINFDDLLYDQTGRQTVIADNRIEQACEAEEMRELLIAELKRLSEREQMVLNLYYFDELTLKEIGMVLGLTESRISQIHSQALMRLRSRIMRQL